MQHDIWKILALLFLGLATGFTLGYPFLGALIAALGVIAWQIHRFRALYKWVNNASNYPILESSGQLLQLHRELSRKDRSSKMQRRRLTALVAQFRQAVSVLPDAIVLIDTVGRIQWANNNAEKMFGVRWPADARLRLTNLVRDPKLQKFLSASTAVAPNESGVDGAALTGIEIRSGINSEQMLNIKIIPYTNELSMVLARDVTRLMTINQMHTDFVANVSHELKTPLTVLRGYLEILEGNPDLPNQVAKPIQQMAVQSKRMQMIVQDLLFLSKIEGRENRNRSQIVDVKLLVNAIVEMIQPEVNALNHTITLDIDPNSNLRGNQSELHSAFSNLILNAVKYTAEGGEIKVLWRNSAYSGASFEVRDNGPGIPSHHLPRLTQRFYRVDSDRSREGGGTGLGLAIVKHVLQRHNAKLEIQSIEGEGSTFICQFPSSQIKTNSDQFSTLKSASETSETIRSETLQSDTSPSEAPPQQAVLAENAP